MQKACYTVVQKLNYSGETGEGATLSEKLLDRRAPVVSLKLTAHLHSISEQQRGAVGRKQP